MALINLPYGNNSFESDDLLEFLKETNRDYIIQGQTACKRMRHPKPNSLDCWLRDNYAQSPDTKQAVNQVIADIIRTGDFKEDYFRCPDSGKRCKGIRVVKRKI